MFFNKFNIFSNTPTSTNQDSTNTNEDKKTENETTSASIDTPPTISTNTTIADNIFTNTFKKYGNKDTLKKFGTSISLFTNNVIQKFDDERKKFIEESSQPNTPQTNASLLFPPWLDFSVDSKETQKEIVDKLLDIKMSKKTFLTPPPIDSDYCQEFDVFLIQIAKVSLQFDPMLEKIRFYMVPRFISEEQFWKNWYYRITLIKIHYNLPLYHNLKDLIEYQENLASKDSLKIKEQLGESNGETTSNSTPIMNNKSPQSESVKSQSDIEKWEKELQNELESFNINDITFNNQDLLDDDDWESKINMELESNTDIISTPTQLHIDSPDLGTTNEDSDIELELEKELMKIKELEASKEMMENTNGDQSASTKEQQEEIIREIENELNQFKEEQELEESKK
ncbi:hypothetical protein DLAC_01564 [Tieghemostelium lacteum]|uniref:BSD domain-containing protein n=1 Tax=Tieghemostelium lacteum TaxID=361077 RepID=A0A152A5Q3_TIELA|nr:hypothetical protein DLAC_01564 [Tieghemostelium lacteum]|eukprot:KYR01569.1 hypothetical protein DLAC_01564 [Tieghemostelium lacteum]